MSNKVYKIQGEYVLDVVLSFGVARRGYRPAGAPAWRHYNFESALH